ncbi:hypothetical protein [Clostridium ihumii]|uniref:hypothetical protein n=1 Tax=Clostridium ihumii TaxID=1470356 RepID=UPI000550BAD9|nr:hypothetical protein [Clostridium ihumii]
MLKERSKFIFKITIIHIITYVVCGIIFMTLFDYQSTLAQAGMRDTNSLIVGLAPVFQIVRGALFGIVLWVFRNSFINSKYGWLIIWMMIVIVGLVNTPSTAPGSIEYFIYYKPVIEPWNLEIGGMIEILTQTFLFSVISFKSVCLRTK